MIKALGNRQMARRLRQLAYLLRTNSKFRKFHEHETDVLPEFYHYLYEHMLGPYAELMSREDRRPTLASHKQQELLLTLQGLPHNEPQ